MESIKVPKINHAELLADAFEDHERFGGEKRLEDVSDHDMNHILLNYIRHKMVRGYNYMVFEDQWQYFSWFSRINRSIAAAYPFLKLTAEQQINRKEGKLRVQRWEREGWEEL